MLIFLLAFKKITIIIFFNKDYTKSFKFDFELFCALILIASYADSWLTVNHVTLSNMHKPKMYRPMLDILKTDTKTSSEVSKQNYIITYVYHDGLEDVTWLTILS